MYDCLNRGLWEDCFSLIDPKLREQAKVQLPTYTAGLQTFKEVYGSIKPWHVRIRLHLDVSSNKHDNRPFAYVYVVWQDEVHGFHMFRERWVKDGGRWFTRVVGLVPNRREPVRAQD
jgi:hypothetical protein